MASNLDFGEDIEPDEEDEYDMEALTGLRPSAYPFFQTTDPALRSAYSFGDPRGGSYPEPPTPQGPSILSSTVATTTYEDVDDEDTDDDDDDDDEDSGDAMILDEVVNTNDPRRDPDYHGSDQESIRSSPSSPSSESQDPSDDDAVRLVGGRGRPRGRPRGSRGAGRSRGSRGSRGRGRGRGRAGSRAATRDNPPPRVIQRKRKEAEPSVEFRKLNAKVTAAWIAQDYDTALHYGLEAVKLNPDVFELHGTIAEILIQQGRKDDAIGALVTGVHASGKAENWWYVVNRLEELGDPNLNDVRDKLMYCYTSIIRLKGDDLQARKLRMRGYMEQGLLGRARNDAKKCLHTDPGDIDALRFLAEISASLDERQQAAPFFKNFVDKCMHNDSPENTELGWEMLNWYIDILLEDRNYETALTEINTVSRWLLGRKEETYWDDQTDDREWDVEDEPRRIEAAQFRANAKNIDKYGEGLPIELRIKLGVARLGLGGQYLDEALHHFNFLEPEDPSTALDYADLFREAGDALVEAGFHGEALRFYESLKAHAAEPVDFSFSFDLAIVYHALDKKEELSKCIGEVKEAANGRDPKYQLGLAKLYKAMGREDLMWKLILVLKRAGKRGMIRRAGLPLAKPASLRTTVDDEGDEDEEIEDADEADDDQSDDIPSPATPPIQPSSFATADVEDELLRVFRKATVRTYKPRRKRFLTEREEALKDAAAQSAYTEIQMLSDSVASDDPTATARWLQLCGQLFDDFRTQPAFYTDKSIPFAGFRRPRQLRVPDSATALLDNPSVDFEVPTAYRTVPFDGWVDLLLGYGVALAARGLAARCWAVLDAAEDANVVAQHEARLRAVKVAGLACALALGDERRLCERARWFVKAAPYQSDVYRLYSAVNRACRGSPSWYNAGPEQKFLMRRIKAMDLALLAKAKGGKKRAPDAEENPHPIEAHDPALLALYGHIMLVAGSYGNALMYYFRAYAVVPDDPVVCLCIAVSYIGIAFKRQTVERQYLIQQGLSFLQKYYDIRTGDGIAVHEQEAEFNMALMWHKMGLVHLALERYDKVLQLSQKVRKEGNEALGEGEQGEDFAADAAFAIQTILAIGGDMQGARRITEKWLVIE